MNTQTKKIIPKMNESNNLKQFPTPTTSSNYKINDLIIAKMAESFDSGTTEYSIDSCVGIEKLSPNQQSNSLENNKQQKIESSFDSSETNGKFFRLRLFF